MNRAILDKELKEINAPGLGVIVYKNGDEIYSKFLGQRDIELNKPVNRYTRFRAASVSKMFTIFSIMQLVEQGKLNLDDDASKYLGFELRNPNFPQKKITVRMLASHTSSLRDGKIYSTPPNISVEEFFSRDGKFFENGAHFATEPPEKFFSYCNLNYGLLGTIIESVTGKRFDIYQRENILKQLETRADYLPSNLDAAEFEMLGKIYRKNSEWFAQIDDFETQPAKDTLSLQNPYDKNFQYSFNLKDYRIGTNATIFSPQGGLRISFEELAHALEMLMNDGIFRGKKILSRDSLEEILTPHWIYDGTNGDTCGGVFSSYGLGIYPVNDFKINLIGHSGAAFGLLSGLFFVPNTKSGFVYMLNGSQEEDLHSGYYICEEKIMRSIINFLGD